MGHKSETEEGGLTLTGPNPKSNHTSPSLPLTDPGRVSFTAHVTSTGTTGWDFYQIFNGQDPNMPSKRKIFVSLPDPILISQRARIPLPSGFALILKKEKD